LRRAERLRDEGARAPDGETAAGRLKEALAVHPADSFLRDLLAGVYLMKEPFRPALALAQLDLAIQSSPTHAVFWAQKAELLLRSGDPARAQEAAMRAVSLEPQFGSAHLLLAEAALAQGRPVLARAALDRVGQVRTLARSLRPASAYERLLLDVPLDRLAKVRAALGGPR